MLLCLRSKTSAFVPILYRVKWDATKSFTPGLSYITHHMVDDVGELPDTATESGFFLLVSSLGCEGSGKAWNVITSP